jgi:hypothetical protein
MQVAKDVLKVALRVLTAINARQEPDQSDIDLLHQMMPEQADTPIDELACDVIQHAIERRAEVRMRVTCRR